MERGLRGKGGEPMVEAMYRNSSVLPPLALALLSLALSPGCASYQAYEARFRGPDYTVTPEFFRQSPRRVAIFPFAARSLKKTHLERAQVCRLAFYQHFSVRDFEDVELKALDDCLLPQEGPSPKSLLRQFSETVRKLDVVGLTSFVEFDNLLNKEVRDAETLRTWIRSVDADLRADAYVLGIVRGYGRFYAVAFSSIGLATRVELRSTKDDALLWSAETKARNIALPLTIDPLDVPVLLYDIWKNSRGEALDMLAYRVYRNLIQTLPPMRAKGKVMVRADRQRTRIFPHPTLWAFWPKPQVKKGTRMEFLLERRGWYQCRGPDGQPVWMLCRDGSLVDEEGLPLEQTDPMGFLWKNAP